MKSIAAAFFALVFCCTRIYAQQPCLQHSRLYTFYKGNEPKLFTDTLGRRPEFPFLQRINGVNSPEAFIQAIRDPAKQKKYAREFKAFDLLLRNSGFANGYKDLKVKSVSWVYIRPGTVGNLGFYDKDKDVINYEYVILSPAGEAPEGTSAWKLTNASGCFLYILHTCGNGFYPNEAAGGGKCEVVTVAPRLEVPEQQQKDSVKRPVRLTLNSYLGQVVPSHQKKKKYDTLYRLTKHKDSLFYIKDRNIIPWKLSSLNVPKQFLVCHDSLLTLNIPLVADSVNQTDTVSPIAYVVNDTTFKKDEPEEKPECDCGWEISIDGGNSYNSIPRFDDPTQHTQTNGAQPTAEFAISKIMSSWFQLGVSASYIVLSYQDDILYPGTTPGTYNKVYLGKPIIPVQLFGKFTLAKKQTGFQANVSISLGYSIPTNGKIENEGTTLTTQPNLKGDFTAGFKMGLAYFFSCHFGIGLSFTGQYFNNKGDMTDYNIFALPITGGLRFRF
ncbi:MAG TPA: hypothetical protein VG890_17965 [Puia sp.]|nr:hypothetical protein [Puia sp.]